MATTDFWDTTFSVQPQAPRDGFSRIACEEFPEAVQSDQVMPRQTPFQVEHLQVTAGPDETTRVSVRMRVGEAVRETTTEYNPGDKAMDVVSKVLTRLTTLPFTVLNSNVYAVTEGPTKVVFRAMVQMYNYDHVVVRHGTAPDALTACVLAYVNALNQVVEERRAAARRVRVLGPI